jgi:Fur family peroxide stress response transcriptional regulator
MCRREVISTSHRVVASTMNTSPSTSAEPIEETLRSVLEHHGQRFTEQRAAVFRYLCSTTEHPTADEVFTAVRGQIADISLATVYKALETLVSCNLAAKLTYGDGSARYDARTDEHFHTRCLRCDSVRDVATSSVTGPLPQIHPTDGFRVAGLRLEIVGYCESCA